MKFLKITLVILTFSGIATSALAQETGIVKGNTPYSLRFDHEVDDGVMANLEKIKHSGIGYRWSEGSTFGVTVDNGIKVGFNLRF